MNFFSNLGKQYVKILTLTTFIVGGVLVVYIGGCQDLSFTDIPEFDCGEDSDVEGVGCHNNLRGEADIFDGEADVYDGKNPYNLSIPDSDGDGGDNGDGVRGDDDSTRSRRGRKGRGGDGGDDGSRDYNDGDGDGVRGGDDDDDDDDYGDYDNRESNNRYRPNASITTRLGRINILFVVDNSKSMEEELAGIANQFDTFLENIKKADYQIAITTTEIGYGKNNGRFVEFSNGQKFLSNPAGDILIHRQNVQYFQETIKPVVDNTDDERGIYALNAALDNAENDMFFRPHSLFVVIVISDEDERSYGGRVPEGRIGTVPPLESYDEPETFFRKASHKNTYSIVSLHSIIVKPGDTQCQAQSGGVEGRIYAEASNPSPDIISRYGNIRPGHLGSICATDYNSQLGPIANTLLEVPPISLPCFPEIRSVYLKVNRRDVRFRVEGRKVIIADPVSFGSEARVLFRCQNQN